MSWQLSGRIKNWYEWSDEGSALDTGQIEANRIRYSGLDNQQSFFKSCDQAYYQTQKLSMTENNFLFLIRQKAY